MMKRVRLHYSVSSAAGYTPIPASVRFRAFCATDVRSASPFDPTQGIWTRLGDKLRQSVPEITLSLGDIQSYLRDLKPNNRAKELEALRLGSTALFFFSSGMLEKLKNKGLTTLSADDLSDVVSGSLGNVLRLSSDGSRLIIPLLVRAMIQDDWMQFSPENRSNIHAAIADDLSSDVWDDNSIVDELVELPYSLPWKNRKLAYALEALRHYMRAAQTNDAHEAARLRDCARKVYSTYLEQGIFLSSISPTDGNRQPGTLSRSFGLDGLKFEALCLLSEDKYGLTAPVGIDGEDEITYFREAAIALTHLLRPREALEFFDLARSVASIKEAQLAYLLSHKITAWLELGEVAYALDELRECEEIEKRMPFGSAERNSLSDRLSVRAAAIHFAQGERNRVEPEMAKLAGSGLTTYSGERVLLYIDSRLPPFPDSRIELDELGAILMILEQARNDSLRKGFEHERIRLDIRRARIYQLLDIPIVAVPVLERVGIELFSFGASEITLYEFQMASAQTLCLLKKPGYAFSAYAWPLFNRLSKDQLPVRWEAARQLCIHLANKKNDDEVLGNQAENPFRQYIEDFNIELKHPFFSFDLLPSVQDVEDCFRKFQSQSGRAGFLQSLA